MKAQLVFFAVLIIAQSQTCNYDTEYLYYKKCVKTECVDKMVNTLLAMTSFGPFVDGQPSQFSMRSNYIANQGFSIILQWQDGQNGVFMLRDRANCVDFSIYQRDGQTVQSTRVSTVADTTPDKVAPQWPSNVTYIEDKTAYTAQIVIRFTADDVKNKCKQTGQGSSLQYECYFELAFRISGKTQSSNYFGLQINMKGETATTQLNITPLIRAAPLDVVEVKVSSSVAAFSVLNNDGTVGSPIKSLNLGSNFYLEHTITDSSFKNWFLRNTSIIFASSETAGKVSFTTNVASPGRNVYQAQAKLVENVITYTVTGILSQNRRILQEQKEARVTYGEIKFNYPAVSDDSASIGTSNTTTTTNTTSANSTAASNATSTAASNATNSTTKTTTPTATVTTTATISTDKNFKSNNNPKVLKAKASFYVKVTLPSKYSKVKIATAQLNYNGKNTGPPCGKAHQQGASVLTFIATTAMSKKKVTLKGALTNKLKYQATFTFPTIQ